MSWVMVAGIAASIIGSMWAKFEHDCPAYWALWGLSRHSAHIINLATSVLFPGGYLLVLLAPGTPWWVNVLAVLGTHFIGVQLVAPLLMGMMFSSRPQQSDRAEGSGTTPSLAQPSMPVVVRDSRSLLRDVPDECLDLVVTSPRYDDQPKYANGETLRTALGSRPRRTRSVLMC